MTETSSIIVPPVFHTVPLIPVRDVVVFPSNEVVLTFGRKKSITAVNYCMTKDKYLALFTQKDPKNEDPNIGDLYQIGTLCQVERTLKTDGELNALVRGVARIRVNAVTSQDPIQLVEVVELPEDTTNTEEIEALARHLTTQFREAVNLGKVVEFTHFMRLVSGVTASELVDQVGAILNCALPIKQEVLEMLDLKARLYKVTELLTRELKVLEIEKSIASKTQEKFSKSMRENILRERLATIRTELGEIDELDAEHDELYDKAKKLPFNKVAKHKLDKELARLDRMSPNNPEYNYLRTWVETVLELPWGKVTPDKTSLKTAENVLNADHYGLEEVKERILEYLAVMKLKQKALDEESVALPTILCFVGPPGVGKTSLGRSIARALHRKFVKVSLGGIRDEAEIRGHRKTYIGAMPGRIIEGMKNAGSMNPVFMLDELDKVGNDFRGDPASALLEALDPEQNKAFSDHYLELPMDLSKVVFIATANVLDTIPGALRDRLEVIRFSGYTQEEKLHIAKDYLLAKVLEKNAIRNTELGISDATIKAIIDGYTREAGVRNLERVLSKIARKVAHQIVKIKKGTKPKKVLLNPKNLDPYLGPITYLPTIAEKSSPIGQATGLAWTSVGGDILFIEVATMPGSGKITITGQLGDVMKESAQAAYSFIRSHYNELGLKKDFYKNIDIHVHVPEGAVPKDGPSAGVTLTTAMVSAFTHRRVKKTFGMTGEVTLRGRVLEIGGLKEKSLAAYGAGLKEIIIPFSNTKDLEKLPKEVKEHITFHPVKDVSEVLSLALLP